MRFDYFYPEQAEQFAFFAFQKRCFGTDSLKTSVPMQRFCMA